MSVERNKVSREQLRRLARANILTTDELAHVLNTSDSNAAKKAFDLKRRGFLVPVRRGVYAAVPLDADPGKFRPDPYLAATTALGDRYAFSFFSALALLGGEGTVRRTVHLSGPGARARVKRVAGVPVHVHSLPRKEWSRSTRQVQRGGQTVRVTTPERTLVDIASLSRRYQDYEAEVQAAASLLPMIDPSELLRDALAEPRKSTRARLGHLVQVTTKARGKWEPILDSIAKSLRPGGTYYLGTAPGVPNNRFEQRFGVVYPGGV